MKNSLFFCFFLVLINSNAQYYQWAKGFTGTGSSFVNDIEIDSKGNTFISGRFTGSIDFDPGTDIVTKTSVNKNYSDGFLCKIDSKGKLIWVKQFNNKSNSSSDNLLGDIILDGKGNMLVISNAYDNDPSPFVSNINGIALLKLDYVGELIWAKQVAGLNVGSKIKLISNDRFIISTFSTTIKKFVKLDTLANILSTFTLPPIPGSVFILDFDVDKSDNIFMIGEYDSPFSICKSKLDSYPYTCLSSLSLDFKGGSNDVFVVKYSSDEKLIWLKGIQGVGNDRAKALKVSNTGNVIVTGDFTETIDLDPSTSKNYQTYHRAFYAVKLTNSGDYLWGKAIGSSSLTDSKQTINIHDFGVDNNENLYFTGVFKDTADFDPDSGTTNSTSQGKYPNSFYLKLNSNGSFSSVNYFENFYSNYNSKIKVKSENEFYISGQYGKDGYNEYKPIEFDLGYKSDSLSILSSTASTAFYLTKSGTCPLIDTLLNAPDSTILCEGSIVKLSARSRSELSYQWQKNNIDIGGATFSDYLANTVGSYRVRIFTTNNCSVISTTKLVTVNVTPISLPIVTQNVFYCQNASATKLNATGTNLKWYLEKEGGNAQLDAPVPSTQNYGITSYFVTQTTTCESKRAEIKVSVAPISKVYIEGLSAICTGTSKQLKAPVLEGLTYQWKKNGVLITGATDSTLMVNSAGSYSVRTSLGSSCSSESPLLNLVVETAPTVSISGPSKICWNGKAMFRASVAYGVWAPVDNTLLLASPQGLFRNSVKPITDNYKSGVSYTVKSKLGACTTKVTKNVYVRNVLAPSITVTALKTGIKVNETTTATATTAITSVGTWSPTNTLVSATSNTLNTKTAAIKGLRVGSGANVVYFADDASTGCRNAGYLAFSVTAAASLLDANTSSTPQDQTSLYIYPNPTRGSISFQNTIGAHSLTLMDMNGRKVQTHKIEEGQAAIDFRGVVQGKYLVKLEGVDYNEIHPIVIE